MKKIEKQIIDFLVNGTESKCSFEDIKKGIDINNLPKIKNKRFPLWAKIAIPSSVVSIAVLTIVVCVTLNNLGLFITYPKLNLSNYRVDLSDAKSVGIMPYGKNKEDAFVKQIKGTDEIQAVDFVYYSSSAPKSRNKKYGKEIARLNSEDSFNQLVKKQDEMGWVVSRYFVYDDEYTFLQFVPKNNYFKYNNQTIANANSQPITVGAALNMVQDDHGGYELGTTMYRLEKVFYHINDTNPDHYYNGSSLVSDWKFFSDRVHKSYVIHNETGHVYSLADVGINLDYCRRNYLTFGGGDDLDNPPHNIAELSISSDELIITTVSELPVDNLFRDRYGQLFGTSFKLSKGIYSEKNLFVLGDGYYITTADNRLLFIEDNTLYEYKDNFEVVEVPEGVTYRLSGFYSNHSYINNKSIFSFPNYLTDIKRDVTHYLSYDAIIGDYYFYREGNNLKCIKDPLSIFYDYLETHPSYSGPIINFSEERNDDWWPEDNQETIEYQSIIKDNSILVMEDIDEIFVSTDCAVLGAELRNPSRGYYPEVDVWYYSTDVRMVNSFSVRKWTFNGYVDYAVYLDENGDPTYSESYNYVPEDKEYVLSPINS